MAQEMLALMTLIILHAIPFTQSRLPGIAVDRVAARKRVALAIEGEAPRLLESNVPVVAVGTAIARPE